MRDERIARLEQRLADAKAAQHRIIDQAEEARGRDSSLTTTEDAEFRALTDDIREIQERLDELLGEQDRNDRITAGSAAVRRAQFRFTEPGVYGKGTGRSYLRDLSQVALNQDASGECRQRLEYHAQDVARQEQRAGLDRVSGTGGHFVPPQHLIDEYVPLARAGRPTANLCTQLPLPGGTDVITVPKIVTGASVAIQTADGADVSETDMADDVVTAPVVTVAGQQTVAQQLLDQSPINFDDVVFKDLAAAQGTTVDQQVISGSGNSGQMTGILTAANTISISYTDTSPSAQELFAKIADGVQRIHMQRFAAPSVIVMSPRRWGWLLNTFDTTGRPLIAASGPGVNQLGSFSANASQQVVGNILGLPVVTDPSIPVNLGTGTNEDVILIMKADDLQLWESQVYTRALPEVLSGKLQVRLQLYSYAAFLPTRSPKAIVKIGGTGLVSPSW